MEIIELKKRDVIRALQTLEEIVKEPYNKVVRDAAIQRFEYTFEIFWKFVKSYLTEEEGLIRNSPRGCFRELFSLGIISEDETVKFLEMVDDRNRTSHTYNENIAEEIYSRVKNYYLMMNEVLRKLTDKN